MTHYWNLSTQARSQCLFFFHRHDLLEPQKLLDFSGIWIAYKLVFCIEKCILFTRWPNTSNLKHFITYLNCGEGFHTAIRISSKSLPQYFRETRELGNETLRVNTPASSAPWENRFWELWEKRGGGRNTLLARKNVQNWCQFLSYALVFGSF